MTTKHNTFRKNFIHYTKNNVAQLIIIAINNRELNSIKRKQKLKKSMSFVKKRQKTQA